MARVETAIPGVTEISEEQDTERDAASLPPIAAPLEEMMTTNMAERPILLYLASAADARSVPDFRELTMHEDLAERFREIVAAKLQDLQTHHWQLRAYDPGAQVNSEELEVEYANLGTFSDPASVRERLAPLATRAEPFDQGDRPFVRNLRWYAIIVQMGEREPLYCLRAYSEAKAFTPKRPLVAIFSSGEYTLVDRQPLSFDEEIDVLIRGEHMYILQDSPFHRLFPDFEPMMHNADALLTTIRGRFPMREYERFEADCRRDPRKIAKLHRIVRNPYFASLTLADLGQIAARHPQLAGVVAREPDGTEILVYAPGYEWKMLKLLNDDFLYSEMIRLHYDTSSKRVMRQ